MRTKKRIFILITAIGFLVVMAFLTIVSRPLYERDLVKVRIAYPEQRVFFKAGKPSFLTAIPSSMADVPLFSLTETRKNKEKCFVVHRIDNLVLGSKSNGFISVEEGLSAYIPIIVSMSGDLTDGQEVLVENEEDILW